MTKELILRKNPEGIIPARQSPLAFLMGSELPQDLTQLADGNPLIENIKINRNGSQNIEMTEVKKGNMFDLASRYETWLRNSAPKAYQKYLNYEVNAVLSAWALGRLTEEYPLDKTLIAEGFLQRTVDGHEFRTVQMAETVELGFGWKVIDVMVVPTGKADVITVNLPQLIRGASPPIFGRVNATKEEVLHRTQLVDGFAKAIFGINKDVTTYLHGRASIQNGIIRPQIITFEKLVEKVKDGELSLPELHDLQIYKHGETVHLLPDFLRDALDAGAKGLEKNINPVIESARLVGDDFIRDYIAKDPRINHKSLQIFTQKWMTGWAGTLLLYFKTHFNDPANDALNTVYT